MFEELTIIHYPDPRLLRRSRSVSQFDASLKGLADRMFQLMRESRGVGLAAPQVGVNIRMFVMNPTGQEGDDRIYINPELLELTGEEEAEEGCLSLPGVHVNVLRATAAHLKAQDLEGKAIERQETGYPARIWQHEIDHLNGTLLIDRMGAVARMSHRRVLKDLEAQYAADHPSPPQETARKRVKLKRR
jgi:peptide deformylase